MAESTHPEEQRRDRIYFDWIEMGRWHNEAQVTARDMFKRLGEDMIALYLVGVRWVDVDTEYIYVPPIRGANEYQTPDTELWAAVHEVIGFSKALDLTMPRGDGQTWAGYTFNYVDENIDDILAQLNLPQ